MRRPFILFLIILTLFCWYSDLVQFLFYLLHLNTGYRKGFGSFGGIVLLFATPFLLRKFFDRDFARDKMGGLFSSVQKKEWTVLFLASLPIILVGLFRCIYPDQNYDTLHFELYLQEYKLGENHINFGAGSIRTYYFPLPERMFAVFRNVLGYRLGTIVNVFLLVTILASLYDLLKKIILTYRADFPFARIVCALLCLFIVFADNTLFNIGSYKPDLIGIPFLLELMHIVFFGSANKTRRDHFLFFLLASIIVTFKLTYFPYVGILVLIYLIRESKRSGSAAASLSLSLLALLVFPSIYLFYNTLETGNPIFPFFNKIFHSPLYPDANFKDVRWGPRHLYEVFVYPMITYLDKSRCNEWGLYSYRLLLGYVISLGSIFIYLVRPAKAKDPLLRLLFFTSLLAVLFDYSCIVTTGYYRYGIIVEILYGLVIALWMLRLQRRAVLVLLSFAVFAQVYVTFKNIVDKNLNLSWHDYSELLTNKMILKHNASRILGDYGKIDDPRGVLPGIKGFVCVDPFPQEGLSKLLNKNIPIYNIDYSARTPSATADFESTVLRPKSQTENLAVVANIEAFNAGVISSLNKRGYLVTEMNEVYPAFMKFGEPVFVFSIKYMDTSKYSIKQTVQYLRDENPPETRNDFSFHSTNQLQVFIREAPFAFGWNFLPDHYDISINGQKHTTNNRFRGNSIFKIQGSDVQIHKPNSVPYLIVIEEIEQKP